MADMYEALKKAQVMVDNPEKWKEAKLQAFDEMVEHNHDLAERAYAVFDDLMEQKRKRSEAAKKRRRKQSETTFYDTTQHNEHQPQ